MEKPIIELVGVTKFYGSLRAVDDLDLSIRKGEVYGLLGPNGAGKTTTILMMLGLTEPSSGHISVCGYHSSRNPVAVKRKVGYLPDNLGFYDNLSALDNVTFFARLNGLDEREARNAGMQMLDLVGLSDATQKKAGTYSRGMKQRLGLATVLVKQPEVIILDEPTLGIDPSGVKEFLSLIRELSRQRNLTVLLSSHHLNQVQQVCDRIGIFVGGKLVANDHIEHLSQRLLGGDQHVVDIVLANPVEQKEEWQNGLSKVPGVTKVDAIGSTLQVASSGKATPAIVRYLVEKGLDILSVSPRELGLDEIYQRYFEKSQKEENGIHDNGSQKSIFKRRSH